MTHEEMIKALADVRDQLVRDAGPYGPRSTSPSWVVVMRRVVQDWADGARSNCEALEHVACDCAGTFTVQDIFTMIRDAAREMTEHQRGKA